MKELKPEFDESWHSGGNYSLSVNLSPGAFHVGKQALWLQSLIGNSRKRNKNVVRSVGALIPDSSFVIDIFRIFDSSNQSDPSGV